MNKEYSDVCTDEDIKDINTHKEKYFIPQEIKHFMQIKNYSKVNY
jgi:hypothetical protein